MTGTRLAASIKGKQSTYSRFNRLISTVQRITYSTPLYWSDYEQVSGQQLMLEFLEVYLCRLAIEYVTGNIDRGTWHDEP